MAGVKGRQRRERNGPRVLWAEVDDDVIERLDAGAVALGWSRAKYIEEFVRRAIVDQYGLPAWVHELAAAEQLPLHLGELLMREEQTPTAA